MFLMYSASLRRGWELLELFCGSFSPTMEFYPYLLHFLFVSTLSKKNVNPEIVKLSKKCGNMVKALMRGGSRLTSPNFTEWENIVEHRAQVIEVHFPDKSSKKLEIQTTDKVKNLMQALAEKVFGHNQKESEEYILIIANPNHGNIIMGCVGKCSGSNLCRRYPHTGALLYYGYHDGICQILCASARG
jgi:hypothetical protein